MIIQEPLVSSNLRLKELWILHIVRETVVTLQRAPDAAQPPLDMEIPGLIIVCRCALDSALLYEAFYIFVGPLENRQILPALLTRSIYAAYLRLFVSLRSLDALRPADADYSPIVNLILFQHLTTESLEPRRVTFSLHKLKECLLRPADLYAHILHMRRGAW
ncbi:MAG: hypothetical protein J6Y95_06940, partial [Lachnospiraceae bacterium]|nr:hypothetical protein [Lachnospiraceae bacterium]